jgi:hypothetical protein
MNSQIYKIDANFFYESNFCRRKKIAVLKKYLFHRNVFICIYLLNESNNQLIDV